jgi:hypothetical protein
VLRNNNLGRADAMLVTADELIVQLWSSEGGSSADIVTRFSVQGTAPCDPS